VSEVGWNERSAVPARSALAAGTALRSFQPTFQSRSTNEKSPSLDKSKLGPIVFS
jgi:hypothetical protein